MNFVKRLFVIIILCTYSQAQADQNSCEKKVCEDSWYKVRDLYLGVKFPLSNDKDKKSAELVKSFIDACDCASSLKITFDNTKKKIDEEISRYDKDRAVEQNVSSKVSCTKGSEISFFNNSSYVEAFCKIGNERNGQYLKFDGNGVEIAVEGVFRKGLRHGKFITHENGASKVEYFFEDNLVSKDKFEMENRPLELRDSCDRDIGKACFELWQLGGEKDSELLEQACSKNYQEACARKTAIELAQKKSADEKAKVLAERDAKQGSKECQAYNSLKTYCFANQGIRQSQVLLDKENRASRKSGVVNLSRKYSLGKTQNAYEEERDMQAKKYFKLTGKKPKVEDCMLTFDDDDDSWKQSSEGQRKFDQLYKNACGS